MKSSTPLWDNMDNNKNTPPSLESGDRLMASLAGAAAKSVFYIGITVVAGMYISSCQLDASTIDQCQKACTDIGTRMESVTSRECECMQAGTIEAKSNDIWVLP
ncbi:hypothetical protein CMI47_01650 [Candidatus Pacearchaeota archaeon]|jgi:hypothetical protein|nr:hypothetical protein [Candidatus Pacearchaeota archaeon]|tara:strand:+ start:836 stop:1147 length:312 start_codon:yes stop_codon:yes gene_type:complete